MDIPPLTVAEVDQALSSQKGFQSLQASLRLKLIQEGKSKRLEGAISVSSPDQLRLDLLSILGPPVGYLAMTRSQAGLYLPYSGNTFFRTSAPEELVRQLTANALDLEQLIGMLLGRPPPCPEHGPGRFSPRERRYEVSCKGEGRAMRLLLDPEKRVLAGLEREGSRASKRRMEATFEEHGLVDETWIPHRITLNFGPSFRLEMRIADIRPNPTLVSDVFVLEPPPGANLAPLEALLAPAPTE